MQIERTVPKIGGIMSSCEIRDFINEKLDNKSLSYTRREVEGLILSLEEKSDTIGKVSFGHVDRIESVAFKRGWELYLDEQQVIIVVSYLSAYTLEIIEFMEKMKVELSIDDEIPFGRSSGGLKYIKRENSVNK